MANVVGQAVEAIAYINGKRIILPQGRGEITLLQFLRESGLTGTKLGCGEGGCGACTVMLSSFEDGKIVHRSANACLCPLYAVEGMHVITVEGIGNVRQGLHPVQEVLSKSHGSQCGFCTPGFVMSMYALLRSSDKAPTEEEVEDALGGNLCRCTGYRPILDAFKTFTKSDPKAYTEEAIAASKGLPYVNGNKLNNGTTNGNHAATTNNGSSVCPSSGLPCDCKAQEGGCGGCGKNGGCSTKGRCGGAVLTDLSRPGIDPIFPPELKKRPVQSLYLPGPNVNWYRPSTLNELLELRTQHPSAKIVVGNTEVGIEMKFKGMAYPVIIAPTHVPELNSISMTSEGVEVGASVTLTKLMNFLKKEIANRPGHETETFKAVVNQLRWFAGNQIRNVSAIGGNIVTGSPISDLNPIWMASGARFTAISKQGGERSVLAADFFLGYRQVDLKPEELLYKVLIPFTKAYEYVKEFKQSPRREDDIAIVNGCMRVSLVPNSGEEGDWVVAEASVAFGGVAAKAIMAKQVAKTLVGKRLSQTTLEGALAAVGQDVVINDNAPGGKVEYRRALAASFVFKFFIGASLALERDTKALFSPDFPPEYRSAGVTFERHPAHGVQFYATAPSTDVVGQPSRHMAADLQVTGEATYVDDIRHSPDVLVAALVLSTRPHARLLKVDPSAALTVEGVAGYFGAADIPGSNMIGPKMLDEEVFATNEVTCVGQVIGVVVAETEAAARRAAKMVAIEYEDLPYVMSCEEAIELGKYAQSNDFENVMKRGDVDACFASGECDHIIQGTYKVGGQEHFYLETQACCIIPQENDEFLCISSTQAVAKHQKMIGSVLGVPAHKIVSKTKRLGGGFGGKETRGIFLHCAIAVPAYHLKRPVRIMLDRDEDMQISGQRHAFLTKYKVGFTSDGMVKAIDMHLFAGVGNSWDLSQAIIDRALLHSDGCYQIPHIRVHGHMVHTNTSSNTAFRGFGGPQGLMFAEMWIEQVARTVGRPTHEIRSANFQHDGYVTHYGQTMTECRIQRCWDQVIDTSDYHQRLEAVKKFNTENRFRKRGLTVVPTKFGISFTALFMNQAGALVHIYLDGTVLVSHGGVEMGQGLHTKMAMVTAQALGIPLNMVFISETSTDKVPNASPTAASASSDMYGAAILDACRQLKERLAPYTANGTDWVKAVNSAYMARVDLSAHGFYLTPDVTGGDGNRPFNYYAFGASVSEVELDVLTGDFHLLRADIVMDVGNPINPAIDIGQVEGGFIQGMGWTCIEELQWGDKQHPWIRPGQLFTRGPGTYKIPSVNDIPIDFRVTLLADAANTRAIHSSKAVGEPPFHLGASVFFALKEAVYAARRDSGLGDRWFLLDVPATPERLRMLCADAIAATYAQPDFRAKISC
ncbi:hypothetical protein CEUSTIGMA_g7746.t1 [Chlamydomonas eustigma]|uniref:xanthine dehydrogenase n=1 Tax=Chlamydomonas eustigma TaxID=1157962 RepID=A0A250XB53_9CHLO|nr:hypothetical protein CEUSTIGMA_g7746.t1 [Chlamydomonas eustigma]|eukprot:GAX80308.1 hypothetical protein CEUSTIGMA_g7746.t1 [Chlamydomonas eustigma]